ncbi:hypothetical protein [Coxiella burnetii]|uniref:IcmC n=1 Tax=Coxiella burnetii (strain RSA 493 / Nine Mile phase I) TaxID=227377 RepID=Q83B88_COXBU|nr:hypothetical protein [Coxiella burnetii]NP_820607.1 Icm secretion system protein IcmC [Coxiella burnetii RSA 493]AAO91121.1 IcmC [Coxiella burnetii RSA 493]ABX77776.1 IcmC protein [Coxiella burnetii RSA 331]ACJ17829.1 IcmC [Coxiella burnetii CbuG_Q212]AML48476.1 type IV secretion protein IcmC [Coxiella burnetii]AML54478.1 type IV secretion protein IcmC [Coxiella burnetii]
MISGINPFVLMQNLGYMAEIVQSVSIIMGLGLFMMGIFRLKRYGEMRTFMSHQMTIAAPLLMMIAGIALMCLPVVLSTALTSFWSTSNPLHYHGGEVGYEQLIPPIIVFVRLIGVGAFIRGVLLFSRVGREQTPPGTMAKAMLHILGGLFCVHILGTLSLLKSVLGMSV